MNWFRSQRRCAPFARREHSKPLATNYPPLRRSYVGAPFFRAGVTLKSWRSGDLTFLTWAPQRPDFDGVCKETPARQARRAPTPSRCVREKRRSATARQARRAPTPSRCVREKRRSANASVGSAVDIGRGPCHPDNLKLTFWLNCMAFIQAQAPLVQTPTPHGFIHEDARPT